MAQQIIDVGTSAGAGNGDIIRAAFIKANENFTDIYGFTNKVTGGAQYKDNALTSLSPLAVVQGSRAAITNNRNVIIDVNIPTDFTSGMLDSSGKLLAVNAKDYFSTEIRFKAKSSVISGIMGIQIDIGGSLNVIREAHINLHKTANTESTFAIVMNYFTGSTFITNGGTLYLNAISGNISLYDVEIIPMRVHKGY